MVPTRSTRSGFLVRLVLSAAAVLLGVTALTSWSAFAQQHVELDPELEARAADLNRGLMCPLCAGQTISQSNSPISQTMRQMVRERLAAGDSDSEIYAFMVDAFGESVLASPPTSGVSLMVWVVPPIALLLGGLIVGYVVRRLVANHQSDAALTPNDTAQSTGSADAYLSLVDREMGTTGQQ